VPLNNLVAVTHGGSWLYIRPEAIVCISEPDEDGDVAVYFSGGDEGEWMDDTDANFNALGVTRHRHEDAAKRK